MIVKVETKTYASGVKDIIFTACPTGDCPATPKEDDSLEIQSAYTAHLGTHQAHAFGAGTLSGAALDTYAKKCYGEVNALGTKPVVAESAALLAKVLA